MVCFRYTNLPGWHRGDCVRVECAHEPEVLPGPDEIQPRKLFPGRGRETTETDVFELRRWDSQLHRYKRQAR